MRLGVRRRRSSHGFGFVTCVFFCAEYGVVAGDFPSFLVVVSGGGDFYFRIFATILERVSFTS